MKKLVRIIMSYRLHALTLRPDRPLGQQPPNPSPQEAFRAWSGAIRRTACAPINNAATDGQRLEDVKEAAAGGRVPISKM